MSRTRIVIAGAAGRDFHNFNLVYRGRDEYEVVAFTATQIPNIEGRVYPAALAGDLYPAGIPIVAEDELEAVIAQHEAEEVVFAYSDVTHEHVMHLGSRALAAGASYRLLSPRETMLTSSKPVVAVCAVRTGSGKSQTTRYVAEILRQGGRRQQRHALHQAGPAHRRPRSSSTGARAALSPRRDEPEDGRRLRRQQGRFGPAGRCPGRARLDPRDEPTRARRSRRLTVHGRGRRGRDRRQARPRDRGRADADPRRDDVRRRGPGREGARGGIACRPEALRRRVDRADVRGVSERRKTAPSDARRALVSVRAESSM